MTTAPLDRIQNPTLRERIMTAEQAAELIPAGATVGMSGFTAAGAPKAVPQALAKRIEAIHAQGGDFRIGLWTGASTSPDLDGALAKVKGIGKKTLESNRDAIVIVDHAHEVREGQTEKRLPSSN